MLISKVKVRDAKEGFLETPPHSGSEWSMSAKEETD